MAKAHALSLAEVNALIPSLERIFERLEALRREIGARANELERLGAMGLLDDGPEPTEIVDRRRILRERVSEFQSEIDKIEDAGGLLADLDLGLVDFPSTQQGREVWLCWQRGEPQIAYWRMPGAALHERQRIAEPA
jgi:hypothetical protein